MKLKLIIASAAAGACALAVATTAGATTLQKLALEDMVEQSASVVVGEAIASRTERTDAGVFTYTDIQVSDAVVGSPGAVVTVTTLGGRYKQGKFMLAETWPGSPQFTAGNRVMLFLQDSTNGDAEVVGFSQGAINVVATSGGEMVRSPDGDMETLAKFKDRVRAIKSQGRGKKFAD